MTHTKQITTRYTAKCQACGMFINVGDTINWTKGIKGVTCALCPPPVATPAPAASTVPRQRNAADAATMQAERDAAVARCGELQAMLDDLHRLVVMRGERADELLAEIAALKAPPPTVAAFIALANARTDVDDARTDVDDDCPF